MTHLTERGDHGHDDRHDPDVAAGDHGRREHRHVHGWARVRHTVSELTGAHSHDAAEYGDARLEADTRGRRALWISLAVLSITAAAQGAVVTVTGSVALLGDTLHNVADAATAVPLLVAFWLAGKPATDRYPYGYGRAEDLAGLFVVAMIALSAVVTGYEAVDRLLNPRPVSHLWAVAAAGVIGFAGNEVVARLRIRVGEQIGSAALVADGLHARTDGFTSLAVVLGALGVAAGLPWADPVIGLLIAVAILGVLRSALAQVGARLMDAVNPDLLAAGRDAVRTVDGVLDVRELRLRWIGHTLHAEADVIVAGELAVQDAHEIAHHAEEHLKDRLPRLTSALIHVSPAGAHH